MLQNERILSRNDGIENGDASDEREQFEDEHLTEPNIFSSDEIVLCENIVKINGKKLL